ncbi:MAG: RNA methyltransferase [Flavobacteriales bacterium]|nr:RNA methyltransferase [Flavobacteriales bacterium]PCH89528.1 MAG: RNA methyltransferase [Flavobacteriales bacterium]
MRKLENKELDRKSVDDFRRAVKLPLILVLDNIRSSHNVGSIFRTADAFLLEGIYLCGITAKPPHREINKTALGATESVDWEYFSETFEAIERLKLDNYELLAVEQTEQSISLQAFSPDINKKYALIFGHEVKGVDQEVIDACCNSLEIPQIGTKHSLNIAVSVGVVVWDLYAKIVSGELA